MAVPLVPLSTALVAIVAMATSSVAAASGPLPPVAAAVEESGSCPVPPVSDVTTAEGWLGYLAAHPGDTAYVVDDGRGHVVPRIVGDRSQPTASAVKVLHLAAYAQAVATGRLEPAEPRHAARLGALVGSGH